ncbi:MAG: rRNA pseudouridine synthase [Spirochaetaceae bacterium]|jgi:23S rRNA pseudouridine2605 synthase|nr:rRNA pseudouridine synthase [Spirochaetaceae bacterium]
MSEGLRLQVFLAHAGVASRRESEKIILAGRITVNGALIKTLGSRVMDGDTVCLDGVEVKPEVLSHYIAMNKPPLYICTQNDPQKRRLASSLLPAEIHERLYTIGRLDYRSCGLLIWTNDGQFAARLGHPSSEIEKEYLVESTVPIPDALPDMFREGVFIDGECYKCREIEKLAKKEMRVVLIEGKNREIRRVFSHFHLHPKLLRRIRIGSVTLGNLAEGCTRTLSVAELERF